jgi:hypothetical protein
MLFGADIHTWDNLVIDNGSEFVMVRIANIVIINCITQMVPIKIRYSKIFLLCVSYFLSYCLVCEDVSMFSYYYDSSSQKSIVFREFVSWLWVT